MFSGDPVTIRIPDPAIFKGYTCIWHYLISIRQVAALIGGALRCPSASSYYFSKRV